MLNTSASYNSLHCGITWNREIAVRVKESSLSRAIKTHPNCHTLHLNVDLGDFDSPKLPYSSSCPGGSVFRLYLSLMLSPGRFLNSNHFNFLNLTIQALEYDVPAPKLDSMVIAASSQNMADWVPGETPDDRLVSGLHHAHLLVCSNLRYFSSHQDLATLCQVRESDLPEHDAAIASP